MKEYDYDLIDKYDYLSDSPPFLIFLNHFSIRIAATGVLACFYHCKTMDVAREPQ